MVTKVKKETKEIVVDSQHFIPVEPSEPILPLKELKSRLCKEDNEQWTTCKVVEDKETGEKLLLVQGYKTKEKDRTKRMVKKGGEFDSENIVSGTRRRKNINYKENTERKESKRKSISKNTYENRSKAVEKASKKKSTTSTKKRKAKEEEHEEDKENIENQEEEKEEEIIQAPKRTRKNRKSISKKDVKKEEPKQEEKEEEWTLPLSPVVCQFIKQLGAELPTEAKKRSYRGVRLPESVNYWCGVKWPVDVLYQMDSAKTNGEIVGQFKHELFELTENTDIEWLKQNPSAVLLADGEGLLACLPEEECDSSDFNVYIILEATEGVEEVVFKMKLSEYVGSLTVDTRIVEDQ